MVISHKYRYVFIEVPHTASTAMAAHLMEKYDGQKYLHKHSCYPDFLREFRGEERKYFVFMGVRNPLDTAVTRYQKLVTDHRGKYSKGLKKEHMQAEYAFVTNNQADFPAFFRQYYQKCYNNFYLLQHSKANFICRFENLAADYATILNTIGVPNPEPLPEKNKTQAKQGFETYYTPDLYEQAVRVFGPFLEEWGYQFPESWGKLPAVPLSSKIKFKLWNTAAEVYSRTFRVGPEYFGGSLSRLFKKLR